jgi:hypothetical protein
LGRYKFNDNGYELISKKYENNMQKLEYICDTHKDKGVQSITYGYLQSGKGCYYCSLTKRSGENHHNWKGGISLLQNYLHTKILQWKKDSMKNCNFKCVITGERFDDIHHLYSFNQILNETMNYLSLDIRDEINKYTEEELKLIEQKCLELHNYYGLGICLTNEIHMLFHKEYGYGNNNPEQFQEFIIRFNNNEFIMDKEVIF